MRCRSATRDFGSKFRNSLSIKFVRPCQVQQLPFGHNAVRKAVNKCVVASSVWASDRDDLTTDVNACTCKHLPSGMFTRMSTTTWSSTRSLLRRLEDSDSFIPLPQHKQHVLNTFAIGTGSGSLFNNSHRRPTYCSQLEGAPAQQGAPEAQSDYWFPPLRSRSRS